jgi:hypothetical protein
VRRSSRSFAGLRSIAEEAGLGSCRSRAVGRWVGWAGEGLGVVPSRPCLQSGAGRDGGGDGR